MASLTPNILTYDITAYLGDTLNCAVTWKDASMTPVDFTGCSALGQIKLNKTDSAAVDTFTITLGHLANNIRFSLSATKIKALGIGKWVYDIQITFPNGDIRTYIVGKLKTTQDVSRT